MISNKKPCRYFSNPGGCRFGNRCNFAHGSPSGTRSLYSLRWDSDNTQSDSQAPPGVCRSFWSTGRCNFEFSCHYLHTRAEDKDDGSEQTVVARSPVDLIAPFLTDAGLAKISRSGTDAFSSFDGTKLNPQMTQDQLRRFLADSFRFHNVNHIYAFASLLSNASSENKSWTDEDGQLLLTVIASGNGLILLGDALRWPSVATSTGGDSMTLSFQRGFLPILQYFSSNFVVKSTLNHLVNALYSLIDNNIDHVTAVLEECMSTFMRSKTFKDSRELRPHCQASTLSGSTVFAPVLDMLFEYLTRFKHAFARHNNLGNLVNHLEAWVEEWVENISSPEPTFDDPLAIAHDRRLFVIRLLKDRTRRVSNIISRDQAMLARSSDIRRLQSANEATTRDNLQNMASALLYGYEGPGTERQEGPRHDNDFVEISQIQIAPTNDELVCREPPYLPANISNAPHTYPPDSIQRLLDIQFRLLREELTAPLRSSVQIVIDDIHSPNATQTRLQAIRNKNGGRYQHQDRAESVIFNVYTGIRFEGIQCDHFRGIVAEISFDTPPGSARSESAASRTSYWEGRSGKRLVQGGLIALVWCHLQHTDVYLGNITSTNKDIVQSAGRSRNRITVKVHFFEHRANVKIVEALRAHTKVHDSLLLESPVMFEAIRPFLESLKREPETIPFKKYLAHPLSGSLNNLTIDPPCYSLVPNYHFQLNHILEGADEDENLTLKTNDSISIMNAREELKERSRLDHSQVDAIIDTLTREVSLIQGPPGTGKTFVGIELIRVLVKNGVGPILMISFTNHALDHLLGSILDANISRSVVRLGARCTDERVLPFSMEEKEKALRSRLLSQLRDVTRRLKDVEQEMKELLEDFVGAKLSSKALTDHLRRNYLQHWKSFMLRPHWIDVLYTLHVGTETDEKWHKVTRNGKSEEADTSIFGFWREGTDLIFLQQSREANEKSKKPNLPGASQGIRGSDEENSSNHPVFEFQWQERLASTLKGDNDHDTVEDIIHQNRPPSPSNLNDPKAFFKRMGKSTIPTTPMTDRSVDELLNSSKIWDMTLQERRRLTEQWETQCREHLYGEHKREFDRLSEEHEDLREEQRSDNNAIKLNILLGADIVGCTTTGAARLTSMLKGLSPKVMLVEEAGQVLESHILGSLVDSVEQLILIGDPQQLRPTLNNYSLSMDSARGGKLYRFDMSLMERLSSYGLAMSRLAVQRRMRPEISSLVRNILYPGLIDHDNVKLYPHVRGMLKDVFFLSHSHREQGGGEDSVSKHNVYEANMIKDLVLYLLRQGPYAKEGSIVVLCAYLGQICKVRSALSSEVIIVTDERDEEALGDDNQEQGMAMVRPVHMSQRVKIRSVDNFQGEEADIVILSLVRNSGSGGLESPDEAVLEPGRPPNIGFLKSDNRTNVALSRARHGLYILGNASDLSERSPTWATVVNELRENGALGSELPIACHKHPEEVRFISRPDELPQLSPDGGCLKACEYRLSCGHICPLRCHSDDEEHRSIRCDQSCRRLCSRGHPCSKICAVDCGACSYKIQNIDLPCGHTADNVECWQLGDLSKVFCRTTVIHQSPDCEHTAEVECGAKIGLVACQAICGGTLACCGKSCESSCFECQELVFGYVAPTSDIDIKTRQERTIHKHHPCGKPLHCQHPCQGICDPEHQCSSYPCTSTCRQACSHSRCPLPCSSICSPCQEQCTWTCVHQKCPMPCGSICTRLPCDWPCNNTLPCGHPCPSVCGEPCKLQACPSCDNQGLLEGISDFATRRPLHSDMGDLNDLTITLPDCGHTFTVMTLDELCGLNDHYERDFLGNWCGLKAPPSNNQHPSCPKCLTMFKSPRYGRVFKRANLDLLDTNISRELSRPLHDARRIFYAFNRVCVQGVLMETADILADGFVEVTSAVMSKRQRQRERQLHMKDDRYLPLGWAVLDPGHPTYHGVSKEAASEWREAISPLQFSYEQAHGVALAMSGIIKAWEAAFASLKDEKQQDSEERPIRVACASFDLSKPLAKMNILVEAIWLTIEIRYLLAELATAWLKPVPTRYNYDKTHGRIWATYILFLFQSSVRDARLALQIAEESGSQVHILRSKIFVFNSMLEIFTFSYRMSKDTGMSLEERQRLADQSDENVTEFYNTAQVEVDQNNLGGEDVLPQDDFSKIFLEPAEMLIAEWDNLSAALRSGASYKPVSFDEKMRAIGAFVMAEI